MPLENLKVAIVHDVLDRYGGAERVVKEILNVFPQADLFASRYLKNTQTKEFDKYRIQTSFMQNLPFYQQLAKFYTPLYPLAFENFDLSSYDLIISSTAHFAKGILTRPDQLHICYCHTPPRFLFHYRSESETRNNLILKPFVQPLDSYLRQYDYKIAQRPDYFLTNSFNTAKRIQKFYRREALVMYPPVDVDKYMHRDQVAQRQVRRNNFFLIVSRLVKYKNLDSVINAIKELPDERLIIIGTGPEEKNLRQISVPNKNIQFVGFVKPEELVNYYKKTKAVIFPPSDEDFGIVPVESMAAGTPVIALKSGGSVETVIAGKTGIFYSENEPESITSAIKEFNLKNHQGVFKYSELINQAKKFSSQNFRQGLVKFVEDKMQTVKNR